MSLQRKDVEVGRDTNQNSTGKEQILAAGTMNSLLGCDGSTWEEKGEQAKRGYGQWKEVKVKMLGCALS